jgi:hypothetical protein
MDDFFEVTRTDSWGHLEDKAGDFILEEGDSVEVLYPDGKKEERMVETRQHFTNVSDMGYSETIESKIPFIRILVHGMSIKTDLFKSEIKVRPISKWVGPLETLKKNLAELREKNKRKKS